ncbi:MAG: hypothetical protein WCX61_04170 [Candidatus Peribacteraceae bacterium]
MVNLLPIRDPDSGDIKYVNQVEIPHDLSLRGDGDAYVLVGNSEKIRDLLRGRIPIALEATA